MTSRSARVAASTSPGQATLSNSSLRIAAAAALTIFLFQFAHSQAVGGLAGLLKVGEDHPVQDFVSAELPSVPLAEGQGHDGQLFYVVGIDPFGTVGPQFIDDGSAAYRYRRIGYPFLSGLGGTLGGHALLIGLMLVTGMSAGAAAGAAAEIASMFGKSRWLSLGVVLNPGVWLSGILLTADNLALALGLMAILTYVRGSWVWSAGLLAGAALTKEVAICFALGLAGHALLSGRRRLAAALIGAALSPLLLWMAYLQIRIGNGLTASGQASAPFFGIVEAAGAWLIQRPYEFALAVFMLAWLVIAVFGLRRSDSLWRWLTWPWIVLATGLSHWVWGLGTNAARTLSPIIALTVLGLGTRRSESSSAQEPSSPASP